VDGQRVDAATFARDGVVCVRGVLDPRGLASAARAIDIVLAAPGPLALVASSPGDPGSFTEDFCRWRQIPEIEELARHSAVPRLAAQLMATPQVRFYHDHVLVKEGGTRQRTPWHQDQPYYNVDGRGISAWIPVDPVPEEGSLELVAGSHAGPWLMPRTFLDGEARWFPEGSLAELPDIEADRSAFDIRRFGLEPGDAVFFDFLTVHGAPGFPFAGRRRVLSLRYLSAEARHAPRAWRTSPPFAGLADELPAGAPMNHPLFPVVQGWARRDHGGFRTAGGRKLPRS
jgi:ectoine hydroxylase-related dioxygenase (phytanoyl-CoA dioxygenase family)